jgi:hypothetical protein
MAMSTINKYAHIFKTLTESVTSSNEIIYSAHCHDAYSASATSSSAALPARSPIPFTVPSIRLAPPSIAAVTSSNEIIYSAHCHDDLGMAVSNSLAAIEGGARRIEGTVNGASATSSSAALPARSPIPFTVPSIRLAPPSIAAKI